jgi:PAS domain S-box-containing protein
MAAIDRPADGLGSTAVLVAQWRRFPRGLAGMALLVCVAYYLGARLGLALTFQPLPISVLWPPNAILFAALLLVPTRHWWIVLAAALPAHLASELPAGIPFSMVFCWYVSNVSEALIGAGLVRLAIGEALPFERTRDTVLFFAAAAVAAVASSFLDSAFVKLNRFSPTEYWSLWKSRTISNLVADAVIASAVLGAVPLFIRRLPRVDSWRFAEGALLALGLVVSAVVVFDTSVGSEGSAAQIYLPMPFLLWAAFRFGVAGASLSFSSVTLIAIWGASHGVGVLGQGSPMENVRSLQLFALCLGPMLLCLAAAVAERDRAARVIRDSHMRLSLVLEATRDTIYERDIATGRLAWSRNGPTLLGYEGPGSLDRFSLLVDAIHPDDRHRVLETQEHARRNRRRGWEVEYRLRRADGTYAHFIERGYLVYSFQGIAMESVGRLTDISERRTTEELNRRLAQASKLTAMGELAASIAHEINQPVSAILANVDAAEMMLERGVLDGPQLRAVLGDIRSDDLRTAEIVRHMRSLVKKRDFEAETFELNALVDSVLQLAKSTAHVRGLALQAVHGNVPPVFADRVHAEQVLLNLVFNAMDAMLETRPWERTIVVTTSTDADGMVRASVGDRGHGIAPEHLERVFEMFFTTKSEGLGLGLSIARSLVLANGGRIRAENNADGGATVSFTLPCAAASPSSPR